MHAKVKFPPNRRPRCFFCSRAFTPANFSLALVFCSARAQKENENTRTIYLHCPYDRAATFKKDNLVHRITGSTRFLRSREQ